jgi:hypothetical protein
MQRTWSPTKEANMQDFPEKRKWTPTQCFAISPRGREAEAAYRYAVEKKKAFDARGGSESGRAAWARTFGIEPDDGAFLKTVLSKPLNFDGMLGAVAGGKSRQDVLAAVGRLIQAGLIQVQQP